MFKKRRSKETGQKEIRGHTEPDGKSEEKNNERKKLSNVTSEKLPTGGSHDMKYLINKIKSNKLLNPLKRGVHYLSSGVIQFGIDLESLGHMTLKLFKKLHLHISNHDRFSTSDQFSVIVYHTFH